MNKSPLRRVRFAAWGHHFTESDEAWIDLDISLPFEIMLKEVVIHMHSASLIGKFVSHQNLPRIHIPQKMKFSIKDFFSNRKRRIWSHLLKRSLMENFIFCAMSGEKFQRRQ